MANEERYGLTGITEEELLALASGFPRHTLWARMARVADELPASTQVQPDPEELPETQL